MVFLHGGPGAGCMSAYRRFFNPKVWRVILLDQRGSGRSVPAACTEANTTQHLIADLERLRADRGVERWLVFGGSWGSTLALAYGQAHPEACLGFILRGVFAGTEPEIDWFMHGMGRFFPEAAAAFHRPIPAGRTPEPAGRLSRAADAPEAGGAPGGGPCLGELRKQLRGAPGPGPRRAAWLRPVCALGRADGGALFPAWLLPGAGSAVPGPGAHSTPAVPCGAGPL